MSPVRRVARIWKRGGGGYFERVTKVQTTLTRIFIVLKSVSHGFSKTQSGIFQKSRNFKHFICPNSGDLRKKKKKVFTDFETDFSAKIGNSNVFSAQIQVISKKKVFTDFETDFSPKIGNSNVWGGLFSDGGAIFNFSPEIGLKSTKNVRFCILHKPMGVKPPPPAPPGYATVSSIGYTA